MGRFLFSMACLIATCGMHRLGAQAFFDPYVLCMGQWTQQGRLFSCPDEPLRWLIRGRIKEVAHPKLPSPLKDSPNFQPPPNLGGLGFHFQDALWINGWTRKESVLFRQSGTGWEEVAKVPCTSFSRNTSLIPLRNGRYLVFNPPDPDPKPKKKNPYFYGIFAQDERGELVSRSLESLPERDWQEDANLALATRLDATAFTDDHVTVCCAEYGRFWIFSLEDGRLRHTVDLYGQETAKLLGRKQIPRMVLEFQPRKDGRLLISARDEALIKPLLAEVKKAEARLNDWMRPNLPEDQENGLWNSLQRQVAEVLMPFPHLTWFELDPDTGSLKRLNPSPVGARDILPVNKEAPFWLVDEEDRVIYMDMSFKAFPKAPELKKSAKAGKG